MAQGRPGKRKARRLRKRERAHDALPKERDFISAVMDTSGALIAVADREGRFVRFNRACEQLSGYAFAEVRGRAIWDLLLPREEVEGVRAVFADLDARRFPNVHENDWLTKDGRRCRIAWCNSALLGPDGAVEYVVGVGLDVTQQRQLEERLRASQRLEAIGRLAGGVSHDFNNMLSAILGYSDLLLKALPPTSPARADVEEIRKAAERGAGLTRQLVAFSRGQVLRPQVIDLNTVVREMEGMLKRLLGDDVELVTQLAPDLGTTLADPGQVQQLIMNLSVNAREAMPNGGRLTIETDNREADGAFAGPHVRLRVRDTGTGMSEETLANLFVPFFTTRETGAGMGLSTVYGIVQQSGGTIRADSAPGKGSTFTVLLPRVEEVAVAAAPSAPPPNARGGWETVLLVEDNEAVRKITRRILEDRGYRVLEADGGPAAIHASNRYGATIHLLLTDVAMPRMNGPELAERIRAHREDIRALFISGHAGDTDILRRSPAGTAWFLQKPFSADELARKLREVLDAPR